MFQKNAHIRAGEMPSQDLEERLAAYYGSALPPRALPETSWLQVRDGLEKARRAPQRAQTAPPVLEETFGALLTRVNYRYPYPVLRCDFSSRTTTPRARISLLSRGQVRLALPEQKWRTLQPVEIEVLLAAGLARSARASRPLFLLPRALFAVSLSLAICALLFSATDRRYLWIFCAALVCCLAGTYLIFWQMRALAFRGDRQAVAWLGRERVCQGLHLLAEHDHPQRRPAWGEPSLAERIKRVCDSPVTTRDEHLTLVG
jgi:hypothetical protein